MTAASTPISDAGEAEAEERDGQRQAGGDDRAEREQQDQRRGHQAEALGCAAALARLLHGGAAERDLEALPLAFSASAISPSPVSTGMLKPGSESVIWATAIVPSRE